MERKDAKLKAVIIGRIDRIQISKATKHVPLLK